MHRHVAAGTLPFCCEAEPSMRHVRGLRIDVALQAEETSLAAQQQLPIHSAVRRMACCATFDLYRRVLKNEWAAFLDVTLNTNFPVCLLQHGLIVCAVGVVAVRTFHEAFRHSVMRRQRELRLNGGVALVTQPGLRQAQQTLCQPAIFFCKTGRPEQLQLSEWRFDFVSDGGRIREMRGMA